ncbi:hypothetical protein CMO92_00900 [Candidatus Woesearchaeota archaeon]|nr:hypothetical protein [Candidatus Woesearchaeota archaeon]|tara:strand:- start:1242 stop:1403 length:162 start_codon:yes stop_codon:yes gene_type:complete
MRTRFYPNTTFFSVLCILFGILVFAIPNILEYAIAIFFIIIGTFGLLSKPKIF